jgi:hypothetical protein
MLRVYQPSESDQQYASDERTGQPSEGEALGTSDSSRVPPPGLEIMKVRTGQSVLFRVLSANLLVQEVCQLLKKIVWCCFILGLISVRYW